MGVIGEEAVGVASLPSSLALGEGLTTGSTNLQQNKHNMLLKTSLEMYLLSPSTQLLFVLFLPFLWQHSGPTLQYTCTRLTECPNNEILI
jgi:hypothetical protein